MAPQPEVETTTVLEEGIENSSSSSNGDGSSDDDLQKKKMEIKMIKKTNEDSSDDEQVVKDQDDVDHDQFSIGESNENQYHSNGFWQQQSKRIARSPCIHFWISLVVSIVVSGIALVVGEFSVTANNAGWQSRGTLIADRQTQLMLIQYYESYLFTDDEDGNDEVWNEIITTVQPGWEEDDDDTSSSSRRLKIGEYWNSMIESTTTMTMIMDGGNGNDETLSWKDWITPKADRIHLSSGGQGQGQGGRSWTGFDDVASSSSSSSSTSMYMPVLNDELARRLQQASAAVVEVSTLSSAADGGGGGILQGCDVSWYDMENMTKIERLWPVWKITPPSKTTSTSTTKFAALDSQILLDICIAEQNTQEFLEDNGLCSNGGCMNSRCLPPFSWVLYARLVIGIDNNSMTMDCEQLATAWIPYQNDIEVQWRQCVSDIKSTYDPTQTKLPSSCPQNSGFDTPLVDDQFDMTHSDDSDNGNYLQYTSSIFFTDETNLQDIYDNIDSLDRASSSEVVYGAYDTQWEGLIQIHMDTSVTRDMTLAMGSALVVAIAIMIHTKSPFITLIGLAQIILSFPLSYFVYKMVAGLDFFPFLNFIGVFVLFALGADDVFVAVDKWKNARLLHPHGSTELIAAIAFPDAAGAMLQTTFTTSVAFFATAICPVAPIQMFAIFVGLLVMFDYLMNILLVFPALCIYDKNIIFKRSQGKRPNCCITWSCCHTGNEEEIAEQVDDERRHPHHDQDDREDVQQAPTDPPLDHHEGETVPSLIHRILNSYYMILHNFRWGLLVACVVALILSIVFAAKLTLPVTSDVRVLEDDVQYEQSAIWRKSLLYSTLDSIRGSRADVIWGVLPADTGSLSDPASWSQLVLDESFDPSSEESQVYMAEFCDDLYAQEFASVIQSNFTCSMRQFDTWLQEQSISDEPEPIYVEHCNGATNLPVPRENFHACIIGWTKLVEETTILSRNGIVTVIYYPFMSRVRYVDYHDILDKEWNMIEGWMDRQNSIAPAGVDNCYFTSFDFWWYDTNGQMLVTAYSSAGIALSAAAAVVLFSSRSFVLTFFSIFTIAYVLTSVTATLVSLGWTLGFLESICFAILIGISVDFVIHFGHAYSSLPGDAERGVRTKYALIHMGPSILAAAFTTMASAIIMLFTVITFFQKFALILFFTVIQASVGSFIVFLTLADCLGPSRPTYLVDKCLAKLSSSEEEEDSDMDATGKKEELTNKEERVHDPSRPVAILPRGESEVSLSEASA